MEDEYDTVRLNAGIATEALKNGTRGGRLEWQMNRFTAIKPVDARSELNDLTQGLIGIVTEVDRGKAAKTKEWDFVVTQTRVVVQKGEWYSPGKYRTNYGREFC
jgi:hypothetical protein